jgi:hypothetical protein
VYYAYFGEFVSILKGEYILFGKVLKAALSPLQNILYNPKIEKN